jgi:hypothetical protein
MAVSIALVVHTVGTRCSFGTHLQIGMQAKIVGMMMVRKNLCHLHQQADSKQKEALQLTIDN